MLDVRDLDDYEIQREYLYYLSFSDTTLPKGCLRVINDLNIKAFFPNKKTSNIPIKWGGRVINVSGVDESTKEGNLEFLLTEDSFLLEQFQNLAMMCWGFIPKKEDEIPIKYQGTYSKHVTKIGKYEHNSVSAFRNTNQYFVFPESEQKFDFWIYQVHRDKVFTTTTKVKIINAKVRGFEITQPSKEGTGLSRLIINMIWEDCYYDSDPNKWIVINQDYWY